MDTFQQRESLLNYLRTHSRQGKYGEPVSELERHGERRRVPAFVVSKRGAESRPTRALPDPECGEIQARWKGGCVIE